MTTTHDPSAARARMFRSIRLKLLAVFASVLLASLGAYLVLATSLFNEDKLAYVYDLQTSTARGLADQTESALAVVAGQLRLVASELDSPNLTPQARAAAARRLFQRDADILRVRVYGTTPELPDVVALVHEYVNSAALDDTGVRVDELKKRISGFPIESVLAQPAELYIANTSLPPDAALLTIGTAYGDGAGQRVVAAEVRPRRLTRLFERSKLHQAWLVDRQGRVLVHPDAAKVTLREDTSADPLVKAALSGKADASVQAYSAGDVEYLGGYAKTGVADLTVITRTPRAAAFSASEALITRSILFAGVVFLIALIASILFARALTARLLRLQQATEQIGRGDFDVGWASSLGGGDEVAALGRSIAAMVEDIERTQAQLIHSEKLAAFGQLGAGITHEVKNPIAGIVGLAQAAQMKLDKDPKRVRSLLEKIEKQGDRCHDILRRFLKFARSDEMATTLLNVNAVVEETADLVRHQLNIHNVYLNVELGSELRQVVGNASALQQVMANLALNAQQAMPEGGELVFTTRAHDGGVELEVVDTGMGIPPEALNRIFEPFYTTKSANEGTGLGLSVVHGIIEQHGGRIGVESRVGEGTRFTIWLPGADLGRQKRPAA